VLTSEGLGWLAHDLSDGRKMRIIESITLVAVEEPFMWVELYVQNHRNNVASLDNSTGYGDLYRHWYRNRQVIDDMVRGRLMNTLRTVKHLQLSPAINLVQQELESVRHNPQLLGLLLLRSRLDAIGYRYGSRDALPSLWPVQSLHVA